MANLRDYDRNQRLLLPPDLSEWVPEDDLAHLIIEAVERVDMSAFKVNWRGSGKAQYHPRMMLSLLIYCYANGLLSSRRIERATWRDVGVRFVAADQHPDHDTIAVFRRENADAIKRAFAEVLAMAAELGVVRVGTVAIDGTKVDANASKHRSVRYDRAQVLREQLDADIAALLAQAEAVDTEDAPDPQTLPDHLFNGEVDRRRALRDKLDAACRRLEAEAQAAAEDAQEDYEARQAAWEARHRRGRPPPEPDREPPGERQTNLTDPDSALMRRSKHHEYRQAYNAQAVVDADGSQLILAGDVSRSPSDIPTFGPLIDTVCEGIAVPDAVLGDAGFADGETVAALQDRGIEVLVAISRPEGHRPYDFRPPKPDGKPPPAIRAPWRLAMKAKMETPAAKQTYKRRRCSVEPVFGIIKQVLGFRRFLLRGFENVKTEWALVTLAYNCKRLATLRPA